MEKFTCFSIELFYILWLTLTLRYRLLWSYGEVMLLAYKVKEVADMVGISVRTLHHYDQIGLLKPESVSLAGYRLYSQDNLERLQQILFFKELGFNLKEIKKILDSPNFDRNQALMAQREVLIKKRERLEKIIDTVERTINWIEGGVEMNKEEMFEGFDMSEIEKHKEKYGQEVREKYDREIVEECERKTSTYTKHDWALIKVQMGQIYKNIMEAMDNGPADSRVQREIGRFRQLITDNFYECSLEIFRGLGDLYVNDGRFTEYFEGYKSGLARFMREAMHIYCDNLQS